MLYVFSRPRRTSTYRWLPHWGEASIAELRYSGPDKHVAAAGTAGANAFRRGHFPYARLKSERSACQRADGTDFYDIHGVRIIQLRSRKRSKNDMRAPFVKVKTSDRQFPPKFRMQREHIMHRSSVEHDIRTQFDTLGLCTFYLPGTCWTPRLYLYDISWTCIPRLSIADGTIQWDDWWAESWRRSGAPHDFFFASCLVWRSFRRPPVVEQAITSFGIFFFYFRQGTSGNSRNWSFGCQQNGESFRSGQPLPMMVHLGSTSNSCRLCCILIISKL